MKIPRWNFKGDVLSPLQFVIVMMSLSHNLGMQRRITITGKNNHLMDVDDIKLFVKNEKQLETLLQAVRIYSSYIEIEFDVEKCATLIMKS